MSEIIKIQDLETNKALAYKNDQMKVALNQQPPKSWIKKHPFAKNVNYLPIDKVELLLDVYLQEWRIEVLNVMQLFNSVSVTIRLHYKSPISGEWFFHDGVGAVGIQTDKGAAASDLTAVKSDAVMKALPAAKSYAIKDAAELLGDAFGRNLNRKDVFAFKATRTELDENQKIELDRFNIQATKCTSLDELQMLRDEYSDLHNLGDFEMAYLKTQKRLK